MSRSPSSKALIIGGGIAGLSSAIALAQKGWQVEVFEQAHEITEIGAGLQISPNGVKALEYLGVMERLFSTLYEPEVVEMVDGITGRRVFQIPMKAKAQDRWGAKYYQIHRADLQAALLERAVELGVKTHTGVAIDRYKNTPNAAEIYTKEGDVHSGDLVIGADGLRSKTRTQMLGPKQPRYTGYYAWRCLVDGDLIDQSHVPQGACVWAMKDQHAITTRVRGGKVINFGGVVKGVESGTEDWHETGLKSAALDDFENAHPVLKQIINQTDYLRKWPLYDHAPLSRWSDGNVVLIGDAAHPMLPSLAQGAVQAIEDGVILAQLLDQIPDQEVALQQFYDLRIERVSKIQKGSAQNMKLFHTKPSILRWGLFMGMRIANRVFPQIFIRQNDWIYQFDPTKIRKS